MSLDQSFLVVLAVMVEAITIVFIGFVVADHSGEIQELKATIKALKDALK